MEGSVANHFAKTAQASADKAEVKGQSEIRSAQDSAKNAEGSLSNKVDDFRSEAGSTLTKAIGRVQSIVARSKANKMGLSSLITRSIDMLTGLSNVAKGASLCSAIALSLGGCATTPIPNEQIAVAKSSVQRAEQNGAPELAPVEMSTARQELASAEKAAADHEAQSATQWAEKANVDAQLAEATAQEHRAHKAATEFDASMATLRQETQRSSQPNQ
jgi:Domain of unknown function (DUF4398)